MVLTTPEDESSKLKQYVCSLMFIECCKRPRHVWQRPERDRATPTAQVRRHGPQHLRELLPTHGPRLGLLGRNGSVPGTNGWYTNLLVHDREDPRNIRQPTNIQSAMASDMTAMPTQLRLARWGSYPSCSSSYIMNANRTFSWLAVQLTQDRFLVRQQTPASGP